MVWARAVLVKAQLHHFPRLRDLVRVFLVGPQ